MPRCKTRWNRRKKKIFPLGPLPDNLLISVLDKMEYAAFTTARYSCRWLHDFIERNRSQIGTVAPIKHICMGKQYAIPLKKTRRTINFAMSLGWCENRVSLSFLSKEVILLAMNELWKRKCFPLQIEILGNYIEYSEQIANHPLLKKVRNIRFNSCVIPNLSFLNEIHERVLIRCQTLVSTTVINNLLKMLVSGTSSAECLLITYIHYPHDPVDEILDGIQHRLLWSPETHEQSVFAKRRLSDFVWISCPRSRCFVVPLMNGKIAGVCIARDGGLFSFVVYESEEDFIVDLGWRSHLEYFSID